MKNKEIINENLDNVEVTEVIPEKTGVNFVKIGIAVLAVGASVALIRKTCKLIKEKRVRKMRENGYDDSVEDFDFENEESAE